uniref:High mobility group AT-hook 1 n=1 Tax=Anas platyrhynchos platyrhynchos TaxID=8840 RepID=A0A493SU81_ANAPP
MSEAGAKSSQALASKGEKDASEKRGRGRPRKKPQVRRGRSGASRCSSPGCHRTNLPLQPG